ncbi:hypothetical protein KUTeg_010001 [Tegillarca granosa]|uniref:Uncharacterized protein n=1 Tax=Tegillarca granosa TaxID=220873 RepID=A0ABQ9FAG5_TEGGR|nr:hypothetical protein KUTeg_010001 [Tegillarca granosa]
MYGVCIIINSICVFNSAILYIFLLELSELVLDYVHSLFGILLANLRCITVYVTLLIIHNITKYENKSFILLMFIPYQRKLNIFSIILKKYHYGNSKI